MHTSLFQLVREIYEFEVGPLNDDITAEGAIVELMAQEWLTMDDPQAALSKIEYNHGDTWTVDLAEEAKILQAQLRDDDDSTWVILFPLPFGQGMVITVLNHDTQRRIDYIYDPINEIWSRRDVEYFTDGGSGLLRGDLDDHELEGLFITIQHLDSSKAWIRP